MTEELKTTTEIKEELQPTETTTKEQPIVEKIEAPKTNIGDLKFENGQILIDGKRATKEQLRQMGIVKNDPYEETLKSLSEEDRKIAIKYIGMTKKVLSESDLLHRIKKFKKNRKKNRVAKASRKQNRQYAKKYKLA